MLGLTRQGKGEIIYKPSEREDKYAKYVGDWAEDNFNGQGTLTYADGRSFTGKFIDGKR